MHKRLFVFFCLGVIWLGLAGPSIIQAQDGDTAPQVTVAMAAPDSLDPTTVSRFDHAKRDLIDNLFAGLTRIDAQRGEVVPYLAESWTVSSDGLTWTFTLREDVQWMTVVEGEAQAVRAITAEDVVFAIQRACDPRRPSPLTANIAIIQGCQDTLNRSDTWNITPASLDEDIGVQALDDQTVQFQLLFPASYFLTLTTEPEFHPLPADRVGDSASWPQATTILTSGPWVVQDWTATQLVLHPNPAWPLERTGNAEIVEILFDLDANTLSGRLASGTLDAGRVSPAVASTVQVTNPDLVKTVPGQPLFAVGFSFEQAPVGDPLVRRALSLAVDRQQLSEQLATAGHNGYLTADTFTPRSVIAATTAPGAAFDPQQARALLAQAGYADCANLPGRFTLALTDDPIMQALGQALVQQWQTHLNCSEGVFELVTVSRQVLIDNAHATVETAEVGRYPLWIVSWTADYPDANGWTADALHCQFGVLRTGRACDNTDAVLDQAAISTAIRDRTTGYTQAETMLFGSSGVFPAVPLVIRAEHWVQQPWLTGIYPYGPFQFDRWTVAAHD